MMTRQRRWQLNNPLKDKAHRIVGCCLKTGLIKKANSCEECGANVFLTAHHSDYKKPYDVEWLCKSCHKNRHGTFPNRQAWHENAMPKNLIRLKEAANILDVKIHTIRHWIVTGKLKGRKYTPHLFVVEKGDLEKHIKKLVERYLQALKRVRGRR